MKTVKLDISPGWHISTACELACLRAKRVNCFVEFDFNGRKLTASPESEPEELLDDYWKRSPLSEPKPPNDGGPAYPVPQDAYNSGLMGMTLRDYFAASYRVKRVGDDLLPLGYSVEPLCKLLGIKPPAPKSTKDYLRADLEVEAHIKYMHADAMLAARDKKEGES